LVVLKQRHQIDPNDPKVTLELASIYIRLKQNAQALKLVDSLLLQSDLEIGIRFTVASIYNALGKVDKANEQNGVAVAELQKLEAEFEKEPSKFDLALRLATVQVQLGQKQKGVNVLLKTIGQPKINMTNLLMAAEFFNQLGDSKSLEVALVRLTQKMPESPESWYDLAGVQASNGNNIQEAWNTLIKALSLDKSRRSSNAAADNLYERVQDDPRFAEIRLLPEFKSWKP
jgi:thioredoxin-like negative regulator of GroEL